MLLERLGKNASQAGPPKDPLWDETVLFKTVSGLKWIIWGSGEIAFGAIGQNASQEPSSKDPILDEKRSARCMGTPFVTQSIDFPNEF